jgi:hypothetical protein
VEITLLVLNFLENDVGCVYILLSKISSAYIELFQTGNNKIFSVCSVFILFTLWSHPWNFYSKPKQVAGVATVAVILYSLKKYSGKRFGFFSSFTHRRESTSRGIQIIKRGKEKETCSGQSFLQETLDVSSNCNSRFCFVSLEFYKFTCPKDSGREKLSRCSQ